MVDGLGELVGAATAGAGDVAGIATNAAYDVLKGIGQKALARAMEPAVRDRILVQTVTNLEADGMGAEQAAYLTGLVREKRHLERGAKDDPMALIRLVQSEVLAAGHSKEESNALLTALARAVAQHTSAEPGPAIANVQTLLNTEQTLVDSQQLLSRTAQIQQALSQVLEQNARTPRRNIDDLAALMRRAGQTAARLELDADGRVRVRGELNLSMRASGETAKALVDAVDSVERGEEGVVRRLGDDDLIITTGDQELDDLLKMGMNATYLEFTPTPLMVPMIVRARGEPDIRLDVTVRHLRGPAGAEGVEFALSSQEHLSMTLSLWPTTLDWRWQLNVDKAPITEADRPILQAVVALAKPGTKLYHSESGAKLLTFPDAGEELKRAAQGAQFWLDMLDLWTYLREDLPGVTFTSTLPDPATMSDASRKLLRNIHRHIAGEFEGTPVTVTATALLTEENIALLGKGDLFRAGLSHELHLPGWTPLQLSVTIDGARPGCFLGDQRVSRKKLARHRGKEIELRSRGKVTTATLSAASPREALPDSP